MSMFNLKKKKKIGQLAVEMGLITDEEKNTLQPRRYLLMLNPDDISIISGHACSIGGSEHNKALF